MTRARRLLGKRCLVTGGSRGLGRAMVLAFARAGARVAFTYGHRDADADDTKAELAAIASNDGAAWEPIVEKGNVADVSHARNTVERIVRAWGGIDVLVNNAGAAEVLPIALLEEADWDDAIDVHLKGAYVFARAALRTMIRQKKGHILSIGSFAQERTIEAPVHIASAKAGLRGFTESLAREVGRHGVLVNLLSPGLLDTGLGRSMLPHRIKEYEAQAALGRTGKAEEIARAAVFLVSDENTFMTGAKLVIDGGV